jgi:hypothetical protein
MKKTLDTTCGIYATEYTLTRHRDGSCTVKAPYVSWRDNTGALRFKRTWVSAAQAKDVIWFFENQTTYNDRTFLPLDAELYGAN